MGRSVFREGWDSAAIRRNPLANMRGDLPRTWAMPWRPSQEWRARGAHCASNCRQRHTSAETRRHRPEL